MVPMGKKKRQSGKEDRRAFLVFLTGLLAFLTSVVNMVTGALNFSAARREQTTTAERHYVLKAEPVRFKVRISDAVRFEVHTSGEVSSPPQIA